MAIEISKDDFKKIDKAFKDFNREFNAFKETFNSQLPILRYIPMINENACIS